MTGELFAGLAALALVAGVVARRRILRRTGRANAGLSDDDVLQIEEDGMLVREDESLDMDEIREAEEQFWASESWDEAQEH